MAPPSGASPYGGVPSYVFSVRYWLSNATAAALVWEALTGLLLLFYYEPSDAYGSTIAIIKSVPLGSIILASHLYGAYLMILVAYAHGIESFLSGSYKGPRLIQWITGVLLFALTLGVAFIGYSMTGDVLAVDAVNAGKGILTALGLQSLVPVLFGSGEQVALFTRLLGWHIALTAVLGLILTLHYPTRQAKGVTNLRVGLWNIREVVLVSPVFLMTWGIIITLSSIAIMPPILRHLPVLLSPYPGPSPSSPQAALVPAYPPWFFLFMYKMADMPFGLRTDTIMGMIIPLIVLLIIPFIDKSRSLHPLDRPWLTAIFITGLIWLIELSIWGALQPGVPVKLSEFLTVTIPPIAASFTIVYVIRMAWVKGLIRVKARGRVFSGLRGNVVEVLMYVTSLITVILVTICIMLNPITEEPYIGLTLGLALISLSASLLMYLQLSR